MENNNNDIKLISNNNNLLNYFNEIIFGKYDDGELHNFLILNKNIKNTFFIVSESNDEESISNFITNNIISNNLIKNFDNLLNFEINENNISFSPTNYSILVLKITINENKLIDINTLGLFEWLLSNKLYNNNSNIDNFNLLNNNDYELYALNYNDINKNFTDIISDENVAEILTVENI